MDFLKRLFKGGDDKEKEDSQKGKITLGVEEAKERISELLKEEEVGAFEDARRHVALISDHRDRARDIIKHIGELEFDEGAQDRTYKPILTSKPVYIRGMLDGLKGFRERVPENYGELENYYNTGQKALLGIQRVQQNQGRYMSFAFRKEMLRLGGELNKLIDELNLLGEIVQRVDEKRTEAWEALSRLERLEQSIQRLQTVEEEEILQLKRIRDLKDRLDQAEKELRGLEGSDEYKELLGLLEEAGEIKASIKSASDSIVSNMSSLKRPLRKYEKHLAQGGEKRLIQWVHRYSTSPREALDMEDPNKPMLPKVLVGLGEAIRNGQIRMDEKERKKTISRLEQNAPEGLVKRLKKLEDDRARHEVLKGRASNSAVMEHREELKNNIAGLKNSISNLEKEKAEGVTDSTESNPKDIQAEAEESLTNMLGTDVELLLRPGRIDL